MSESCGHDCGSCSANCSERSGGIPKSNSHEGSSVKEGHRNCQRKRRRRQIDGHLHAGGNHEPPGHRTAILDADITGPSIPKAFGLKRKKQKEANSAFFRCAAKWAST